MSARKQVFLTCTLKELCPEDKQKVAQLVKQVVELGKENQQLKAAAATAATAEEKLRQVQECNKQAMKENCSLKNKLGQAITVLRMYHHKVQGLDAALRALQHSATTDGVHTNTKQQQQQQQEEEAEGGPEPPLPLPPLASAELPQQQPALAGNADSGQAADRPQVPPTVQPSAAHKAAANSQQHQNPPAEDEPAAAASQQGNLVVCAAGQPTAECVQNTASCTTADPHHKAGMQVTASSSPDCVAGLSGQQSACGSTDCTSLPLSAPQLLPAGSDVCLGLPVQQLQAWHLQDSSMFAGQQAPGPPALLQFDASIGSRGAFIIRELPWLQVPQMSTAAGGTRPALQQEPALEANSASNTAGFPAAAAIDAPSGLHASQRQLLQQQAGRGPSLERSTAQQQQELMLAGQPQLPTVTASATAAAAAAASSALAAVKAAAAVCAAPSWEDNGCGQTPQQLLHPGGTMDRPPPNQAQHTLLASTSLASRTGSPAAASCCGVAVPVHVPAAVEEVPVVDLTAAPVHVLVQNEKSASSLHQAHAHVTCLEPDVPPAAAAAEGISGAQSTHTWLNSNSRSQPQMHEDPWQVGVSHATGAWQQQQQQQQGPWSARGLQPQQQQHCEDQQGLQGDLPLHHHQQRTQGQQPLGPQLSYTSSSTSPVNTTQQQQRQRRRRRQQQQPTGAQVGQAVVDARGGVDTAGCGQMHSHSFGPQAAAPEQQQDHGPPLTQAVAQQPRPLVEPPAPVQPVHASTRQQQSQQLWVQQQWQQPQDPQHQQGHTAVSGGLDCGTRELLQRFDESLVDILAEVERLEQQQQRAHQQLQAQAAQQQPAQHQVHPCPVGSIADSAGGSWHDQGLQRPSHHHMGRTGAPGRQAYLDQKQARLQHRLLQLQQEDMQLMGDGSLVPPGKSYRHHIGSHLPGHGPAWGYSESDSSVFDGDDVSDILNHLD